VNGHYHSITEAEASKNARQTCMCIHECSGHNYMSILRITTSIMRLRRHVTFVVCMFIYIHTTFDTLHTIHSTL
jgi:hypothetical protein